MSEAGIVGDRLEGTVTGRLFTELFSNALHFPVANILLEVLSHGSLDYLGEPDAYALLGGALVQAWAIARFQGRGWPMSLLGNLIAPACYTLIELVAEGPAFFEAPNHIAYWAFALSIGGVRGLQLSGGVRRRNALIILESLIRACILLVLYIILEVREDAYGSLGEFLDQESHVFVAWAMPLTGLVVGFANLTALHYLDALRETAGRLREYSEWLLGAELLDRAVADPSALGLARRRRAILFADIRGFTGWSESREPEQVVTMINRFYEAAEPVWKSCGAIKVKLTADEIMLVFGSADQAVDAALALARSSARVLGPERLSLGCGIHAGPVVEGLMGAAERRSYDLLGDSVNTAKRLCDAAAPSEILISAETCADLARKYPVQSSRSLILKGKREPFDVCVLAA